MEAVDAVEAVEAVERSGPSRAQRAGLAGGLAVALVVRVAYLAVKWDRPLLLNDSWWYSGQAIVLADGHGFADPFYGGPSAEHGPLTPIVLAAVSWIDDPVPWQRLTTAVVGMLAVVGIVVLARRVGGWSAAVAAAWIGALYPNLWMNDGLVMSESITVLLVAVVVWLALDVVHGEPGWWRAVACGVACGLTALTRSELVLLVPILLVVVWRRADRQRQRWGPAAALLVAGAAVPLVPWVGANLVRFERPVLLTTNDGTTLLGANCADSYHGPDTGGWSLFCVLDAGGPPGEDPAVRSARQRRLAARYVLDHAGRVPVVVAARVGRLADLAGVRNMVAGDVGEERPRWASWAGVVSFWILAPLAAIGLWRLAPPERWVLLAPVVSVLVTAVAFYAAHRIRTPAEPTIVVGAGLVVGPSVARMLGGRRRGIV